MRRFLARVVAVYLGIALVGGCAPKQADIEKMVRDEVSVRLESEVTALTLNKQPDGGYAGTATIANGDVYDVVVDRPRGGRVQWRLLPSQALAERLVRNGLESEHRCQVKSLNLTKQASGEYTGTAVLETGVELSVTASMQGKRFVWKTEPVL